MLDILSLDWAFFSGLALCLLPLANVLQGCNCCGTCAIAADTFTRGDDSDISTGIVAPDTVSSWTESSGSWAIVSNTLQCTSAGIVICDDAHPDGNSTMVVEASIKHGTSGSTCDILVGVASSTSYYYVRYTIQGASGSVDIRRNNFGSHSSLALKSSVTLNTSTAYLARVCVGDDGHITAFLDGATKVSAFGASITGTKAGLGASGSGTATFDDFSLSKTYKATTAEACDDCTTGDLVACVECPGSGDNASAYYKIVLTGLADAACTGCNEMNGTYYVPFVVGSSPQCRWSLTSLTNPCTGAANRNVDLLISSTAGTMTISAQFEYSAILLGSEVIADIDCTTISGSDSSVTDVLANSGCNVGSATITWEAVPA
jgi:hypothetical protein